MKARQFMIESKHTPCYDALAGLDDFSYREGPSVDASVMIDNPQISLYYLDDRARQAIFVEIPADIDLARVPFVYQTQYEQAQRLFALRYERFHEIADRVPEPRHPIFIYTIGRSGSTLLHHALNESQTSASLSEPYASTQLAKLRYQANGHREAELRDLARSSIRVLFKSHHEEGVFAHALKFHSRCTQVMDLVHAAFPHARSMFLHRRAVGYVASGHRIYLRDQRPVYSSFKAWRDRHEPLWGADLSPLAQYLDEADGEISIVKQFTLRWMAEMEWYLAQVVRGTDHLAVRYATLIKAKAQTLRKIFGYCDLPLNRLEKALRAFERDSQAGTPLARDSPEQGNQRALSRAQTDVIAAMLRRHPVLGAACTPEWLVPGG